MKYSACKGLATQDENYVDIFFPKTQKLLEQALIMFCSNCPVVKACDKYADDTDQEYGVWGGKKRTKGSDD